jgi:hypothetical protein
MIICCRVPGEYSYEVMVELQLHLLSTELPVIPFPQFQTWANRRQTGDLIAI